MTRFSLLSAPAIVFLLLTAYTGQGHGQEFGSIAGVNLTPDNKRVVIKCDGQVGTHSAFVIERPYRLVIDFESTGLGKVARKIKVGRDPIDEIRLGNMGSRARVVVDFGDRPVPTFRIERMNNVVMVMLGETVTQGAVGATPKLAVFRTAAQPLPVRAKATTAPKSSTGTLSVNKAGISDSLVVVELSDGKDPKRKCRLVVDLDAKGMLVRNATLSDARGLLKRFDLAEKPSDSNAEPRVGKIGPATKAEDVASSIRESRPAGPTKYKWGLASAPAKQPSTADNRLGVPFQVERFQLQAKKTDR